MQKGNNGTRFRIRDHYASDHTELLFKLQTYGIPVTQENFPSNGSPYVEWHLRWLAMRRAQEDEKQQQQQEGAATSTCSSIGSSITNNNNNNCCDGTENDDDDNDIIIIAPGRCDVLFGKGR